MRMIALVFAILSANAFSSEECGIRKLSQFYARILEGNPIKGQYEKQLLIPKMEVEVAKQRPNPQINFGYMRGDEFGLEINTYNLTAQHVIELGSKRQKRIDKANIGAKIGEKSIHLNLYQYYVEQIKNYQRIGQLDILISTIKEAIETFDSLVRKLEGRRTLNPEEEISLSTLKLASNEYKTQLNDFENERELLAGEMDFSTQCKDVKPSYFAFEFKKAVTELNQDRGGLKEIEKLKVESFEANLELEKAQGYSNLSIGPQVAYQQSGSDEFLSAGVAVTFNLPLFHTNDGGKIKASKELAHQKVKTENNLKMIDIRKRRLINKYKRSLAIFDSLPTLRDAEKKHQKIEKLFARGIIAMSLTIEAHRQNIEFLKSRFETEIDLLNVIEEMIVLTGNRELLDKLVRN